MSEEDLKAAAQRLLPAVPAAGTRWRHHKGGEYEVVAVSVKEDTLEPLVTYRSLLKGFAWTRTLADWSMTVRAADGSHVPRFAPLE